MDNCTVRVSRKVPPNKFVVLILIGRTLSSGRSRISELKGSVRACLAELAFLPSSRRTLMVEVPALDLISHEARRRERSIHDM